METIRIGKKVYETTDQKIDMRHIITDLDSDCAKTQYISFIHAMGVNHVKDNLWPTLTTIKDVCDASLLKAEEVFTWLEEEGFVKAPTKQYRIGQLFERRTATDPKTVICVLASIDDHIGMVAVTGSIRGHSMHLSGDIEDINDIKLSEVTICPEYYTPVDKIPVDKING